ncbi:Prohibitin-2 [Cyberlindnera fabianii]|uniref:Prohibitin n=1 Tax=Cyberlindnera fabianii TaxID=36022 RepID=A0A1V2L1H7_CYBFA|nr:Prohibitin-2 [Cyberlindnera fabianii]
MNNMNREWQKYAREIQNRARKVQYTGGAGGPKGPAGLFTGIGGLILLGGGAMLLNSSLFNVDGGHRAIVYSRVGGVQSQIYNEGTHFAIPWLQTPIIYDVRAKPRNVASLTGTKDLQMVNITCRVLSRPEVSALPNIYRTLGVDYDERVLPSIVNEAQRAAFIVDKARQEKQGTIVKAQGEAKSAELIGEAIKKSKDYVELKRLDTAREIAQILSNSPNRIILDNEALLLNTVSDARTKK